MVLMCYDECHVSIFVFELCFCCTKLEQKLDSYIDKIPLNRMVTKIIDEGIYLMRTESQ